MVHAPYLIGIAVWVWSLILDYLVSAPNRDDRLVVIAHTLSMKVIPPDSYREERES